MLPEPPAAITDFLGQLHDQLQNSLALGTTTTSGAVEGHAMGAVDGHAVDQGTVDHDTVDQRGGAMFVDDFVDHAPPDDQRVDRRADQGHVMHAGQQHAGQQHGGQRGNTSTPAPPRKPAPHPPNPSSSSHALTAQGGVQQKVQDGVQHKANTPVAAGLPEHMYPAGRILWIMPDVAQAQTADNTTIQVC